MSVHSVVSHGRPFRSVTLVSPQFLIAHLFILNLELLYMYCCVERVSEGGRVPEYICANCPKISRLPSGLLAT
jgi:hypothetical protein